VRPAWFQTGEIVARAAVLAVSCAISYWLITRILGNTYSVSRDDDHTVRVSPAINSAGRSLAISPCLG
jgi:hypothetical protein